MALSRKHPSAAQSHASYWHKSVHMHLRSLQNQPYCARRFTRGLRAAKFNLPIAVLWAAPCMAHANPIPYKYLRSSTMHAPIS